jgi:hypothetical protein
MHVDVGMAASVDGTSVPSFNKDAPTEIRRYRRTLIHLEEPASSLGNCTNAPRRHGTEQRGCERDSTIEDTRERQTYNCSRLFVESQPLKSRSPGPEVYFDDVYP